MVAKSAYLKDQNRLPLWLFIGVNTVALFGVLQSDRIAEFGWRTALTGVGHLLPLGLAILIVTALNGLLKPLWKERIVFLRWRHALPGHRAFSKYVLADPRIDLAKLKTACGNRLPTEPSEQNSTWYRIYGAVRNDPMVVASNREYLLMRDATVFALLTAVIFGGVALHTLQDKSVAGFYCATLVAIFVIFRQAASNYGIRLVQNVLALKASATRLRSKKS